MNLLIKLLLLAVFIIDPSNAARILGLFPIGAKSHMNVNQALLSALHKKGHHITAVTCFPLAKPLPNYREIILPNYMDTMKNEQNFNIYDLHELSIAVMIPFMFNMGNEVTEFFLGQEKVQSLIHSKNETFDLIIHEAFYTEGVIGFAHKFDAPVVLISPNVAMNWLGDMIGNPHPYAYVPDMFTTFTDKMTFIERLRNTYAGMASIVVRNLFGIPFQNKMIQKYFNYTDMMPTLPELQNRVSLVITNSHFSINRPRPNMPNLIEAGGMHIKEPKQLPQDIKTFLDSSKFGVIYFSMGSHIRSADMPPQKKDALLKAFAKIKQNVLWKWEEEELPGKPDNVKLGKWFPQSDILAHPNIKAFISHGGLLGAQESLYHGVPIVGIPIMGDQQSNMQRAELLGYGLTVRLDNITEESVTWALKEIIENPRYRESAQKISKIYRDQPMTPVQTAVYWVEYIIRHRGAPHLRSAALDLTWYQYFLLDVIVVVAVILGAILYVAYFIFKMLLNLLCKKSEKKRDKRKKHD